MFRKRPPPLGAFRMKLNVVGTATAHVLISLCGCVSQSCGPVGAVVSRNVSSIP